MFDNRISNYSGPSTITITQTIASPQVFAQASVIYWNDWRTDEEREIEEFRRKIDAAQARWERTRALSRAPKPPPRAPRHQARERAPAWPAQMRAFRCRAKSTRPVVQAGARR